MLSIVVPVYNAAAHLRECVDSVISQTSPDWELILVDDGSTDDSPAICDSYAASDPRIHVIHQPNSGVSAARNAGIDTATGEYVSFIDSDDYVVPSYCETIIREMSGADLLVYGSVNFFADGRSESHSPITFDTDGHDNVEARILSLKSDSSFEFFGFPWNKCFRTAILKDSGVRFAVGLSFKEDDLFVSSYLLHVSSAKAIASVLYYYRVTNLGLTAALRGSQGVVSFVLMSEQVMSQFVSDSLKAFEAARLAALLLTGAKIDSPRRPSLFAEIRQFVSSHPYGQWSAQIRLVNAQPKFVARILYQMILFAYDVLHFLR